SDATPMPSDYLEANRCSYSSLSDSIFLPGMYGFVFITGLPLICFALHGLYRLMKSENTLPIYVFNLLISDLVQICTLPFWIVYYRNGHVWRFGRVLCSLIGCMFFVSLFVSIFFMCCITLERYLAISHPVWFRNQRQLWKSWIVCLALWGLVSLFTSGAFYFGFEEDQNIRCMENYPAQKKFAIFQLIAMTTTFVLPFIFLLFMYQATGRNMRKVMLMSDEEKKRITSLLSLIIIIFTAVFGPYHIIYYVKYIGILILQDSCNFQSSIFIYCQIALGWLSLNSILDPIMYIFLRKDFIRILSKTFPFLQHFDCWRRRAYGQAAHKSSISTPSESVQFR
uniref:Zgc:171579 n=1 Tax=Erpetoichthys calabaricus TaxID=27687 RepID=A0A8C4T2N0_ERPCA